jgi:hypothetical protein
VVNWATLTRAPEPEHDQETVMMISDFTTILAGERMFTKYTGGVEPPSRAEIARLAYHFYETRGRRDGQDVSDWLAAEQELTRHYR